MTELMRERAQQASTTTEAHDPSETVRFKNYSIWVTILAIAGVAYLIFSQSGSVSVEQRWLAGAVTLIGLLPTVIYLLQGAREPLPLLSLDGAFYTFTFGLPAFSRDLAWLSTSDESITMALWLTISGLLSLYLAYYLSGFWFKELRYVRIGGNISAVGLSTIGWAATFVHLVYSYVPMLSEIPSAGHFFSAFGWIGLGILYLMHLEKRLPFHQQIILFGIALPLELLPRFSSGALYQVLLVGIFMILVYWKVKRKFPIITVALLIGFFVLLNPVKMVYRTLLEDSTVSGAGYLNRAEIFATAAYDYYAPVFGSDGAGDVTSSAVNRVANISTFSYVIEMTPDVVPYWLGETYTSIFLSFIPRIMWPEKPFSTYGNEFGQRYGLLHEADFSTSYNLAWLPEFYANFGDLGVFFGMAFVGIVFRFIKAKLDNPQANAMEYALGLTIVFGLFYAESNLAAMWGGLIITYVTFTFVLRMMSNILER